MTKKYLSILLLIFVLVSYTGCAKGNAPAADLDVTDTVTEVTAEPETTSPPLPEFPREAIYPLSCLDGKDEISDVVSAGGSLAAVVTVPHYDQSGQGAEDGEDPPRTLYIIDAARDVIVSQTELPSFCSLNGVRANGDLIINDFSGERVIIADARGKELRSFDLPFGDIFYDRRSDMITASVAMEKLVRVDPDEGVPADLYTAPWCADIAAHDLTCDNVAIRTTTGNEDSGYEIKLISLKDGTVRDLPVSDSGTSFFTSAGLATEQSRMIFDDDGGFLRTENAVYILPVSGGEARGYVLPDDTMLYTSPYSRYVIGRTTEYSDSAQGEITAESTRLFDLERGLASGVIEQFEGTTYCVHAYLEDCGRFITGANFEPGRGGAKLYVTDPELVEFTGELKKAELAAPDGGDGAAHTLSDSFAAQSERRNELEKKYGVTVLMGDEVYNAAPCGTYRRVSFEDGEAGYDPDTLAGDIDDALDLIDSELSRYPDGFFKTFVNPYGEGGFRLLMVGSLINEGGGSFEAAGVSYSQGAWYTSEICLNSLQFDGPTIHHELWHNVEKRITDEISDAFSFEKWDALNPEGFEYNNDFENYVSDSGLYQNMLLFDESRPENTYFVQPYSTVNEKEDKATLIELLMDECYMPEDHGGIPTAYEWMTGFPHLKAKLDLMAEYTEKIFGSVYWIPSVHNDGANG